MEFHVEIVYNLLYGKRVWKILGTSTVLHSGGDTMAEFKEEYSCSLQLAIDILGGKWKMRIIWYLLEGTQRFSDFSRRIPDITQKTLTQQLRELEEKDILTRKIYAEMPPRVEYNITPYGRELADILMGLSSWAHKYADEKGIYVKTKKIKPTGME